MFFLFTLSVLPGCLGTQALTGPREQCLDLSGLPGRATGQAGAELTGKYIKGVGVVSNILDSAYSQYGKLYRYGGSSPETGFDCSGFVNWCFAREGISLPRTSRSLAGVGVEVPPDELKPGDILIFRRYRRGNSLHVGIYVGDGLFIHSPHTGDRVKESEAFGDHYSARFISARRVVDDPLAKPLTEDRRQFLIDRAGAGNDEPPPAKTAKTKAPPSQTEQKTAANTPKKNKNTRVYKIKKGDTLWRLAKKFRVSESDLRRANNLPRRHVLRIGQQISIP